MGVGEDLLNVPFPEMVSKLAIAIAQSQFKLDMASMEIARVMGDKEEAPIYLPVVKLNSSSVLEEDQIKTSMIGAGFQPTFYQFTDTIIEVKMAITMQQDSSYERTTKGTQTTTTASGKWWSPSFRYTVTSTPVDAKYSSKYSYHVEGSSLLRTKITPIPPNQFMQKVLDMKAQAIQMEFDLKMKQAELALEKKRQEVEATLKEEEKKALPA